MPNIFLDDYSQFPNDLTEQRPGLKKAASYKLLLVILRRVQQYGSMRVKISTKEAKMVTGLSGNDLTKARDELKQQRLVESTKANNQGLWLYEVLDPTTGELRPSRKTHIDFNAVSPENVIGYFVNRLSAHGPEQREDKKWRSRCPFHRGTKDRLRPFEFGPGDGGGVWYCHTCNKGGNMVDLEFNLAIENKRSLSRGKAMSNVKAFIQRRSMTITLPDHDSQTDITI